MKKLVCVLLSVLVLAACVFPVAAKTKQDLLDYVKAELPAQYQKLHYVMAENVISQYDLTSEQCDQLYEILVDLRAMFPVDLGPSLHTYSQAQRDAVMNALDQFCAITGSYYTVSISPTADHERDYQFNLYKADGTPVAVLDLDAPVAARTGEFFTATNVLLIAGIALLVLGGAVVVLRKRHSAAIA